MRSLTCLGRCILFGTRKFSTMQNKNKPPRVSADRRNSERSGFVSATRAAASNELQHGQSSSSQNKELLSEADNINPLTPPKEPGPYDCCGNGCENCVWTTYYEKLKEYRESLKEQDMRRHSERKK
ncbi:hypothetical protein CCYA_CCYA11G3113 [Cyanidiococcus yangmingshanensis]|nr:hypothetical protein CCYA_CCYA11G3113 [Cyanidiococcus yangmingshanensis]